MILPVRKHISKEKARNFEWGYFVYTNGVCWKILKIVECDLIITLELLNVNYEQFDMRIFVIKKVVRRYNCSTI